MFEMNPGGRGNVHELRDERLCSSGTLRWSAVRWSAAAGVLRLKAYSGYAGDKQNHKTRPDASHRNQSIGPGGPAIAASFLARRRRQFFEHFAQLFLKVPIMAKCSHLTFSIRRPPCSPVKAAQTIMRGDVRRIVLHRAFQQ